MSGAARGGSLGRASMRARSHKKSLSVSVFSGEEEDAAAAAAAGGGGAGWGRPPAAAGQRHRGSSVASRPPRPSNADQRGGGGGGGGAGREPSSPFGMPREGPGASSTEVDLSVAALESLLEDLDSGGVGEEGTRERLLNVVFLLRKFQVDSRLSTAMRERRLRRLVQDQLGRGPHGLPNLEDREVVRFISQSVFGSDRPDGPAGGGGGGGGGESAAAFFRSTSAAAEASRRRKQRRMSMPVTAGVTFAAVAAAAAAAAPAAPSSAKAPASPDGGPGGANGTGAGASSGGQKGRRPHAGTVPSREAADSAAVSRVLALPPVASALAESGSWDFDVFHFASQVEQPLVLMMTHLFSGLGLFDHFSMDRARFQRYFARVEGAYLENPYHNAVHATDVVQNMNVFLRTASLSRVITPLDVLAALVAAAVHDVGHTGTTNAFHVATQSELAVRYNDRSVLESFHVAEAFRLMADDESDALHGLTPDQRRKVRATVIEMVLATDMQRHLLVVSSVESLLAARSDDADGGGSGGDGDGGDTTASSGGGGDKDSEALVTLCMALHCADVSNPAKPLATYRQWVDRLVQEWYAQGDRERALGLEVSALMDRHSPNVARSQIGFVDFFVGPLFELLVRLVPENAYLLDSIKRNRAYYEKEAEQGR